MIKTSFSLRNPWAKDIEGKSFSYEPKLSKNWAMSFEIGEFSPYDLFRLDLDFSWRGEDHAGPGISLDVWKYHASIKLYNINHWDYETGTWEKKQ